jgi:uncharacterized membrane protein
VLIAALLGIALPQFEGALLKQRLPTVRDYAFSGSADAAREVLGVIATSMITVTSLTFSLTVITLQLASSQYTPRLLRTFAADRFVQNTLALFLTTFAYTLTVLRSIGNGGDGDSVFVPRIAVTLGSLLAIASVLALVLFLGHLVRQIRIETMFDHVAEEARRTAGVVLNPLDDEDRTERAPWTPSGSPKICVSSSGFLVGINEQALLNAAVESDAVVRIDTRVGGTVTAGVPVADCWPVDPSKRLDGDRADRLRRCVSAALHIGSERTATQDIGYGLRQISDVVIRALSPGINDPTTAVHGLSSCSAVLCHLAGYRLGQHVIRDDDGVVRVVVAREELSDLLDTVCGQTAIYGARDPLVLGALLSLLRDLAWTVTSPEHRRSVAGWLRRLRATIDEQRFYDVEHLRLGKLADLVEATLSR